jgi:hypothetical protein
MSERFHAKLEIGGHLNQENLNTVMTLLEEVDAAEDWGLSFDRDKVVTNLQQAVQDSMPAELFIQEACYVDLTNIGPDLAEAGITSIVYCDGSYEWDGELIHNAPNQATITRTSGTSACKVMIELDQLEKARKAGQNLDDVINEYQIPKMPPLTADENIQWPTTT